MYMLHVHVHVRYISTLLTHCLRTFHPVTHVRITSLAQSRACSSCSLTYLLIYLLTDPLKGPENSLPVEIVGGGALFCLVDIQSTVSAGDNDLAE